MILILRCYDANDTAVGGVSSSGGGLHACETFKYTRVVRELRDMFFQMSVHLKQ
jgi:hypothetical protein